MTNDALVDGQVQEAQVTQPQSQISKITVSRPILCIPHNTDYQPHHIEIDEYEEDQLEEEEEHDNLITTTKQLISHPKKEMNQNSTETQIYQQLYTTTASTVEELQQQSASISQKSLRVCNTNDPDERFLLSCVPIFHRLSNKKNALARLKIQQLLYEIEFDGSDGGINSS